MAKFIVLINSCKKDQENGVNDVNRETWLREWSVPYKFVLGTGCTRTGLDDELHVAEHDTYQYMPYKHRAGFRWALAEGYDYAFQTCTDTYVAVPRLLTSEFDRADYVGRRLIAERYASGGAGFWVSRKAMEKLSNYPIRGGYGDKWVGYVMETSGTKLLHDARYWPGSSEPFDPKLWDQELITLHLGRGTNLFKPDWMRDAHRSFMDHG